MNKWLRCISPKHKYIKNKTNGIVDVVNKDKCLIYIKYASLTKEFIDSKTNDDRQLIWLLSINSANNNDHTRPCKIYDLYNRVDYKLACFTKKCDINNFDLANCFVYLDDGKNIYELIHNREDKYFKFTKQIVKGYLIKRISVKNFIDTVFKNITTAIPKFKSDHRRKTLYTQAEIYKLKIIDEINKEHTTLLSIQCGINYPSNYDFRGIFNKNYNELSIMRQDILLDIDKKNLLSEIYDKYRILIKSDTDLDFNLDNILQRNHRQLSKLLRKINKIGQETNIDFNVNKTVHYSQEDIDKKIKDSLITLILESIKEQNIKINKSINFQNIDIKVLRKLNIQLVTMPHSIDVKAFNKQYQ